MMKKVLRKKNNTLRSHVPVYPPVKGIMGSRSNPKGETCMI
jgi:hypothetical protein